MKTLKEEKAEYARRVEVRGAFERREESPESMIDIEATERGSGFIDSLEGLSPNWKWDEFDYHIRSEPLEFWISIFNSGSIVASLTHSGSPANARTIKVREVIE